MPAPRDIDLTFRASPTGKVIGAAVLTGSTTLVVTVLPKVWRGSATPRLTEQHVVEGGTAFVSLHEGDALRLTGAGALLGALAAGLSQSSATDLGASGALLQLAQITPADFVPAAPEPDGGVALLDLLNLLDRARFASGDRDVVGGIDRHPVLRLLLHRRYLAALEPLMDGVRPTYVEHQDTLATPRGRMLDRSLAFHAQTGWPHVECRFDEHSFDTPLLRVLRAGLQVVVHASTPAQLSTLSLQTRTRAARLARRMPQVALVNRAAAIQAGRMLRLSRFDQPWADALRLGMDVLRDVSYGMAPDAETVTVHELLVPTATLWERVVGEALQRTPRIRTVAVADGAASDDVHARAPWTAPGRTGTEGPDRRPDFMAEDQGGAAWCIDAKYKWRPSLAPTSADGYQLFAYSHLASLRGRRVDACALIYPGAPGQHLRTAAALHRAPDADMDLVMGSVRFPSADDLRSPAAWNAYLDRSAIEAGTIVAVRAPRPSAMASGAS